MVKTLAGPPGRVRLAIRYGILVSDSQYGQVGEWLKPTDCKSVPPCEVRRFESFPVHHIGAAEAVVAQLVERVLGKDEVTSSILVNGSILPSHSSFTLLHG